MKYFAPVLALFLCVPLVARADEASHKAKAEELVTVLHMERSVESISDNAMNQTKQVTAQHYGGTIPPSVVVSLAEFQKKLKDLLATQLGWDVVKPEYVKILESNFTEEQLDGIIAFYKSPAGAAFQEKMPAVQQQIAEVVRTRGQTLQPQVQQLFQDFQKTLPPPTPAPGASPATPPASPSAPPSLQ